MAEGVGSPSISTARVDLCPPPLTAKPSSHLSSSVCIGNIGAQPDVDFDGLCLQDSPLGVRRTDFNSVFPAGEYTSDTTRTASLRRYPTDHCISSSLQASMWPPRSIASSCTSEGSRWERNSRAKEVSRPLFLPAFLSYLLLMIFPCTPLQSMLRSDRV